ncbi:OLC1v1006937C1 [Oldenlandia corymbosa var. corymbosa]|uniref:OLC1v1006937C1 n=1 Tax=Oldenlandia corymbosa var. corymbosa TaxID=529605 RepID=A0AAV1DKV3_OLDCO|nr:OLC1v1006937C1 [Oldenlandia corymbosa var. corymbosa]
MENQSYAEKVLELEEECPNVAAEMKRQTRFHNNEYDEEGCKMLGVLYQNKPKEKDVKLEFPHQTPTAKPCIILACFRQAINEPILFSFSYGSIEGSIEEERIHDRYLAVGSGEDYAHKCYMEKAYKKIHQMDDVNEVSEIAREIILYSRLRDKRTSISVHVHSLTIDEEYAELVPRGENIDQLIENQYQILKEIYEWENETIELVVPVNIKRKFD